MIYLFTLRTTFKRFEKETWFDYPTIKWRQTTISPIQDQIMIMKCVEVIKRHYKTDEKRNQNTYQTFSIIFAHALSLVTSCIFLNTIAFSNISFIVYFCVSVVTQLVALDSITKIFTSVPDGKFKFHTLDCRIWFLIANFLFIHNSFFLYFQSNSQVSLC
jgi:hypothetical protein